MQFPRLSIYRPGLLLCQRENRRTLGNTLNAIGSCLTPPVIAEEMFQAVSRALDRYSWWSVPTLQLGRVMVANSGQADTNTQQVELQYCTGGVTVLYSTVQYCTALYSTVLYCTVLLGDRSK